jgi:hypothetical protein
MPLELLHRGLQRLDLRQMQFDQETMVRGDATVQGLNELGARGFQPSRGEIGQALGISLAGNERAQDRPATGAEDIADDARQLQIRVLQGTRVKPTSGPTSAPTVLCFMTSWVRPGRVGH